MAGIYLHIPFCRQACHYCDFHFSTNLKTQKEMIDAIATEIKSRKNYLTEEIDTIYFGGGTPSILSTDQIDNLLNTVFEVFEVCSDPEITLEANPEDLTSNKAKELYQSGINRLSIGIQTFDESKLKWMNRVHSSDQSTTAFKEAREAGFTNISLDLIYAIPDHSTSRWEHDLSEIVGLAPEHISLYGLTIEPKTVFGKWEEQKKLIQVPEDEAASQYLFAIDFLTKSGFHQYEVSNFGKSGFHSKHNNSYWAGVPYLGVGPGAHSYDGKQRRFNVRNNSKYIKAINEETPYFETENLSGIQRINEQILTQLRTAKGLNIKSLNSIMDSDLLALKEDFLTDLLNQNLVEMTEGYLRLKPHGFLVADEIALRLFLSE